MGDGGEYGGETDERERVSYESKEHDEENHEREVKDLLDELERETDESKEEADEIAKDLERELEDEERAREIANELEKEMEEGTSKKVDDDFERELGHDLDEARDDLHDDFVNDMKKQLDDTSTKDTESTESDTGTSSEMTESSESYGEASGGMAYAMEAKGGSEGETQTESETEQDLEKESQESPEHEPSGESTEDSEQGKFTNKIERREDAEQKTGSEAISEGKDAKEPLEETKLSTLEDYTDEKSEEKSESQEPHAKESPHDFDEDTSESDVKKTTNDSNDSETVEHQSKSKERTQEFEDQVEKSKSSEESDESSDSVTESTLEVEHTVSESESNDVESDELDEYESETRNIDDFVQRVKEMLDEKSELDDNYDYVQDPLTGEMQRVPKILSDYESEEQKQRRRLRNLFAELSEEEREQFKSLVKDRLENEDDLAREVERAWSRIVERAEEISTLEKDEISENPLDLLTAYGQHYFYFRSTQELEKRLHDACEELGIEGAYALQRLNEFLKEKQSERTMFAGNEANPINPKLGRIKGESLRFIMDMSGESIQDLEREISKITGVNGQGGIIEPKFPNEDRLLVVLTRLYSAMASDGNIKHESGKGDYYDPELSRMERVIENMNELGQIKSKIVEKTEGMYRLHIPSVVGSFLISLGFPVGDRTMQNKGLPQHIVEGSPEVQKAYLEDMVPEEGCFNDTTGISWNRTHGLYGTGKGGKDYQQTSLSKEQADYIKEISKPDIDTSKDRRTLQWSDLVSKAEAGNETAKSIVDFVNENPNRLIKDETEVARRLGIEVEDKPYRLRYYKKTGRVSLVSTARTKSFDDAEKWGQMCPPNDVEKRKKMMDWLSKRGLCSIFRRCR